jgi:adiponectin receptor
MKHSQGSSSPVAGPIRKRNIPVAGQTHHEHKEDGACACKKDAILYSTNEHEVPEYMRYQFVQFGYRMNLSFLKSFLSLFRIHNETLNIWTALLSFVVFFIIGIWTILDSEMTFWEKGAFLVYTMTAIYTFLGSLLYHWFNCMSHDHHECLLRMDISGIGFLICGSYYPPIYYAFQNHASFGIFYLTCITIGCTLTSAMLFFPKFSQDKYRIFRVGVLSSTALFGIIPLIHLFFLHEGGLSNPIFFAKVMAVLELYMWYGIAVVFYATKLPERFFPGKFDIVGCSHHWWHTFVFVASYCHYTSCLTTHSIVYVAP